MEGTFKLRRLSMKAWLARTVSTGYGAFAGKCALHSRGKLRPASSTTTQRLLGIHLVGYG